MIPEYERASESRRHHGPLAELWASLKSRAYHAEGEWWWFIRPNGLLIACRVRDDFRKVVRFARKDPVDEKAWAEEVHDALAHLRILGRWHPTEPERESEAELVAWFLELRSNEHAPGLSRCDDCGAEIPSEPIRRPMRCESCTRTHRLKALPDLPDRHPTIIGER